jgi:hypothetical protein
MVIEPGGALIIGSGEAPSSLYTAIKNSINSNENLYVLAEGAGYFYAGASDGTIANRVGFVIGTTGNITPSKAEASNDNK